MHVPDELVYSMFDKARELDSNNPVYINALHYRPCIRNEKVTEESYRYALESIKPYSLLHKIVEDKGSIGEYVLTTHVGACKKIIQLYEKQNNIHKIKN